MGAPDTKVEATVFAETAEAAATALAGCPTGPRSAVGVWVESDPALPVHRREDHRDGNISLVGVAATGQPTLLLNGQERSGLGPLFEMWGAEDAPYVVFHGAHAAIGRMLAAYGGAAVLPRRFGCTQIAAVLLSEGSRKGRDLPTLEACATRVLGQTMSDIVHAPSPHDAQLQTLVARRAGQLVPLLRGLTEPLRTKKLSPIYKLECDVIPSVVAMERAGVAVDGAAFVRIAAAWESERRETEDAARIARLDKLISTYGYWPREYIRGDRIFGRLHPLATDSGRFSCTDPNLQQVPAEHTAPGLRGCFAAPVGHRLVIADYAQIELRVAAHVAGCDALRAVFADGRDPHRATAATITGKPEPEISRRERQLAKAVNFGFLFGMGAKRFRAYAASSYDVALTDAEASAAKEAFLATYPGIAAWHRRVGAMGRGSDGVTVRTVLGRRKRFAPQKFSFNAALNIPVQGTAAEGFKRAMVGLHEALPKLSARGVLCVHDEYVAEAPTARAEEARSIVETVMTEAMASIVTSVPIQVEAATAATWSEK